MNQKCMYSNDSCYDCPEKERLGYCPLEKEDDT